ncbi:MAG TPA: hypothetical protein VM889_04340 [Candidatus Thermoplasmatota archaeon]|nr:hypothetical protein [Candidatus Thermoplasmatota archaeon]
MTNKIRIGAVGLVALLVALPLAVAQAPPAVVTTCAGGATRTSLIVAVDDDSRIVGDTTGWYYLDIVDGSLWKEKNPTPGLQITDMVCTERDALTGAFVRSYVSVPRDLLIAGANEGLGPLFHDLLKHPSVDRAERTVTALLP